MNIILKLLGGSLVVQLLMFIALMISSRLFSPEQFSEVAWYLSVASVFSMISAFRLDYIVLKEDILDKIHFFKNVVLLNLLVILFSSLILILIDSYFDLIINSYLLIAFLFGFSFFNISLQYFVVVKEYDYIIYSRFFLALSQIIILLFLWRNYFEYGLLLANFIPYVLLSIFFLILFFYKYKIILRDFCDFCVQNIKEGFKNSILTFMQYSTPLMPVLFGAYLFDAKNIGAYFLISQAIAAPFSIFRRNLLIYFNGELADKKEAGIFIHRILRLKSILLLLLLLMIISFFIYFTSDFFVIILFGKTWVEFSWLLIIMALYYFFDAILQPFTTLLPLWGQLKKSLYLELFRFFIIFIVIPIFFYLTKFNFKYFIWFYISSMLCIYVVNFYLVFKSLKKDNFLTNLKS